jgi:hypothetical protein
MISCIFGIGVTVLMSCYESDLDLLFFIGIPSCGPKMLSIFGCLGTGGSRDIVSMHLSFILQSSIMF